MAAKKNKADEENTYKILIVDDNKENIKVLGTILMEKGYQIKVASSGEKALEVTKKSNLDLILLDINMPGMDGFETCRQLKKDPVKKNIPVIFLTAYTEEEYKAEAFAVGGVDYITKPFQKEEVLARVRTHLEIQLHRNYLEDEVEKRTLELKVANKKLEMDIIKVKQVEANLIRAQKMEIVGTLASGIAHDFNNLLGIILVTLDSIKNRVNKRGSIDNDKLLSYVQNMKQASLRASDMVKQLLSLSKKRSSSANSLDLNVVVQAVLKISEHSFDKSVKVDVEYAKKPSVIWGDFHQIEQVFLNLFVNAVHAMTIMREKEEEKGGKLMISLGEIDADKYFCDIFPNAKPKKYRTVCICDTGIGMTIETIDKIFNPFFTTKGEEQGSGLGLSMVFNIIQDHNGLVDVYSEPGVGTVFKIYIPAYNASSPKKIDLESYYNKGLILLIGENNIHRNIAREILEDTGYTVMEYLQSEKVLSKYKEIQNQVKLIILELKSPEGKEKEFFLKLKKINPEAKIIISSGFQCRYYMKIIKNIGAQGIVYHPYTMENLLKPVHKLIKK